MITMIEKNKLLTSLGNIVEWFDFSLYGFFGIIFSEVFFPKDNSHIRSLLMTYGIFAAGFASRPLGGLMLGVCGDKYGRLFALRMTPIMMTISTAAIAFLPTYEQAGYLSTLLLIILRIAQGILVSGEFSGNIAYLYEISKKWKYFWASAASLTATLGTFLASIVAWVSYEFLPEKFLHTYGWRIAFLLTIPFGIAAHIARIHMEESPEFKFCGGTSNPIKLLISKHRHNFFRCLFISCLTATIFYFTFLFLPVFLIRYRNFAEENSLLRNSIFLLLHIITIPIFAILVNKIGIYKANIIAILSAMILSIPCFYWICYGNQWKIFTSFTCLALLNSFLASVTPGLITKMTPVEVRCITLSMVINFVYGIFAGLMPVWGLFLVKSTNNLMAPGIYLFFISAISLTASVFSTKNLGSI
ncbi:putative MFS transporter [Candidatus Ichthyocystis hellenicum]|uniref:Putative MFS transporter n=2 Tax=Burkholderiales genera incertae sedis TaxID=224471 RepID=A0A0S4M4Z5_9BURK|nr:putative MFS transporter [Candidatus Ichthyocystis hellenicum]